MNEASIRNAFRRHYAARALSPARRKTLLALLRTGPAPRTPRWVPLAVAALLLLGVGLAAWLALRPADDSRRTQLASAVAKEIARNHAKHEPVEVATDDYDVLRRGLDRLDFSMLDSHDPALAGLHLVGGRHCSLQGHVAAQVQLEDAQGRRATLYEVRDAATFAPLRREVLDVSGLHVEIWHEGGVLMALARPLP